MTSDCFSGISGDMTLGALVSAGWPAAEVEALPARLKLEGVRAGYGPTVVLEDVAFALEERSALAVLGRNGVGKTTLLATIMGLTTFHSGSIHFRGIPIESVPVHRRSRLGIGYVPQTRDIFASLTVEENLAVAARPGRWSLCSTHG